MRRIPREEEGFGDLRAWRGQAIQYAVKYPTVWFTLHITSYFLNRITRSTPKKIANATIIGVPMVFSLCSFWVHVLPRLRATIPISNIASEGSGMSP